MKKTHVWFYAVPVSEFKKLWNWSESAVQFSALTGVGVQVARNRACRLRKRGVKLKRMRAGRRVK